LKHTIANSQSAKEAGSLYIVATPIGNLDDFTLRAQKILASVSVILAEDTRHSKRLTQHFVITTRLKSCHEHNEKDRVEWVMKQLDQGLDLALISDAGTPLISDPGYVLVRTLREQGYVVSPVPGASSIIAALSVAGLPTDSFVFDGFLPAKSSARRKKLSLYEYEARTIVLLESSHRIAVSLADVVSVLGSSRHIVIARELTKQYETILDGAAADVLALIEDDKQQSRGEFVVMLEGVTAKSKEAVDVLSLLAELENDLPLKKASAIVARLTGWRKNDVYDLALQSKNEK